MTVRTIIESAENAQHKFYDITDGRKEPTCTKDGRTGAQKCGYCGYINLSGSVLSKLNHVEVVDAAVAPTCTEEGKTEGKHCSRCNEVIEAQEKIEALGHSWGSNGGYDLSQATSETHTRACTRCGYIETKNHSYGNVQYNCADDFTACTASHKCTLCDYTERGEATVTTETIANSTCVADGSKKYIATFENSAFAKQEKLDTIAALGHTWGNGTVTKEATCEGTGTSEFECTVCHEKKTEIIAAKGHQPVSTGRHEPTCTKKGNEAGWECSVCGKKEGLADIPALGHDPVTVPGEAATCTEKGLTDGEKCSRCQVVLKAQEEIAIDPKNHASYGDWRHVSFADFFDKKMSFAIAERQCTACGEYEDLYINASIELPEGAKCYTKVKIKYKCLFEVREDGSIVEGGHACGHEWTEERYLTHDYDENGICVICGEKKKF